MALQGEGLPAVLVFLAKGHLTPVSGADAFAPGVDQATGKNTIGQ